MLGIKATEWTRCLFVPLKLHSQVGNDRFRVVFPAGTLLLETAILRIPNHKTKGPSCVFPATVGVSITE